jgi:hypothetical protein
VRWSESAGMTVRRKTRTGRQRPRAGESGVGSNAGPICFTTLYPSPSFHRPSGCDRRTSRRAPTRRCSAGTGGRKYGKRPLSSDMGRLPRLPLPPKPR